MPQIHFKDPVSGFSHLLGAALSIVGLILLLTEAKSAVQIVSFAIYGATAITLYTASAVYHLFGKPAEEISITRRLDHASIYLLIAGTLTPFCLLLAKGWLGITILCVGWTLAVSGLVTSLIKPLMRKMPRWLSAVLYLGMGWLGIILAKSVLAVPAIAFWTILGGAFYSIGAIIYAIKKPNLSKNFGFHELFHIFVLLGSFAHFWCIYKYFTNL